MEVDVVEVVKIIIASGLSLSEKAGPRCLFVWSVVVEMLQKMVIYGSTVLPVVSRCRIERLMRKSWALV